MAKIELYNEDCMEGMKRYSDKHFSLAIVDPPYGKNYLPKGVFRKGFGDSWDKRKGEPKKINVERTMFQYKEWDKKPPPIGYFIELIRVSKHQIIWGENFLYHLIPKISSGRIVWDKCHSGVGNFCEIAWTDLFDGVFLFRFMWNGMLQGKSIEEGWIHQGNKRLNEKRIHPTQKPMNLYLWLLKNYAKSGDQILDTHLGSGSIAIACYDMGFDFTGYEIDLAYYEGAKKRLEDHKRQVKMVFV